jgi:hypothetical protein
MKTKKFFIMWGMLAAALTFALVLAGCSKKDSGGGSASGGSGGSSSSASAGLKDAAGSVVGGLKGALGGGTSGGDSAASAPRGDPEPEENFEVGLNDDGTVQIRKYTGKNRNLVIPDTIQGKPVTVIGFLGSDDYQRGMFPDSLTSVYIPEGVTTIGHEAFWVGGIGRSGNLTSVTLPSTLTDIGVAAFYGQAKLKTITIPDGVKFAVVAGSERAQTFSSSGLTSIRLPPGMTVIPVSMFQSCDFETLEIPEGITTIKKEAFASCSKLTSVKLPSTIKTLEGASFQDCRELKTVIIPDSVTSLSIPGTGNGWGAETAFHGCKKLDLDTQERLRKLGWSGRTEYL